MTNEYFGVFQVGGGGNSGYRDKTAKSGVFDMAMEHLADFLANEIIYSVNTIRHDGFLNGGWLLGFFQAVELKGVANFEIVEVLDTDAALVPGVYFFCVILEALQAGNSRFMQFISIPQDSN